MLSIGQTSNVRMHCYRHVIFWKQKKNIPNSLPNMPRARMHYADIHAEKVLIEMTQPFWMRLNDKRFCHRSTAALYIIKKQPSSRTIKDSVHMIAFEIHCREK